MFFVDNYLVKTKLRVIKKRQDFGCVPLPKSSAAGHRRHSRFLATAGRITALAAPLASMSFLQHTPHGEHEETGNQNTDDDIRKIHESSSQKLLFDEACLRRGAEDRNKHADDNQYCCNLT